MRGAAGQERGAGIGRLGGGKGVHTGGVRGEQPAGSGAWGRGAGGGTGRGVRV